MKKRVGIIALLVIAAMLLAAGCGGGQQGAATEGDEGDGKTTYIKFAASTMGGAWFPIAAAMSEAINSNVDGVMATATLGVSDANIVNIENGDVLMAFTTSDGLAAAVDASREPFAKPVEKVRALAAIYEAPIQIAAPVDTGITSIKDIDGKRINAFTIGGSLEVTVKKILEEHGITYDGIKSAGGIVSHVGYDEQVMATKDRLLDVSVYMQPVPSQSIVDIETVRPMTLLKMDDGILDKIVGEFPEYSKTVVPAGTYKGQKEDVEVISILHVVVVSETLSEDLVYEMTKAIFENVEDIGAVHPIVKAQMSLENAVKELPVPLHPGAERYFKEQGL